LIPLWGGVAQSAGVVTSRTLSDTSIEKGVADM